EFSLGELYGEYFGYGDLIHRHTPEIEQELSLLAGEDIKVTFVPHLLPIKRGLYLTIYAEIKKSLPLESVYEMYRGYYREFEAVNIRKGFVKLSSTVMTPNIFIGLMIDDRTKRLVITTSIDNLLKGAASQAVECFDILYKRS
ncbi:MAG: Asd/ArgC dimerization domain-containing protein, partial [Nitrospinota bacterium]